MARLSVGDEAPPFELEGTGGRTYALADYEAGGGKRVARAYGVLGPGGFVRRAIFLVGPGGTVRYRHLALFGLRYRDVGDLERAVASVA